jgi:hypothetical protein
MTITTLVMATNNHTPEQVMAGLGPAKFKVLDCRQVPKAEAWKLSPNEYDVMVRTAPAGADTFWYAVTMEVPDGYTPPKLIKAGVILV